MSITREKIGYLSNLLRNIRIVINISSSSSYKLSPLITLV